MAVTSLPRRQPRKLLLWLIIVLLLLLAALSFVLQSNAVKWHGAESYVNFTGTYALARDNGSGCILKVLQEFSGNPFDEISFELLCNRGGQSYNSGYAMDTVRTANNLAVYSVQYLDKCDLVFEFRADEVEVTQIGQAFDCGFGGAVYATGIYQLKDDSPPILGCLRMDNPCGQPP